MKREEYDELQRIISNIFWEDVLVYDSSKEKKGLQELKEYLNNVKINTFFDYVNNIKEMAVIPVITFLIGLILGYLKCML